MLTDQAPTFLAFHHDAKLHRLETVVSAVLPFAALNEANRLLFKQGTDADFAVVTEQTIFHPQGGGQPSDEGTMTIAGDSAAAAAPSTFYVYAARMDAVHEGQVLHFGRFTDDADADAAGFAAGAVVEQAIDADKRLLYSRLHTAGHVLGAAVRHLLEAEVPGFDELKASHMPGSAACEFRGLIEARWREPIQRQVDDYVARALPVEIDFWDADDFRRHGLERLIPAAGGDAGEATAPPDSKRKFRVVRIVGAETYPCGGTHVDSTDLCGPATVKKISRSKGVSRVSYTVA